MNRLTFALLLIIVSCTSSPDTFTTASGIKFKLFHTNKEAAVAPMISTVKVVTNIKPDSTRSNLPIYKMVMPPAPYISDPLAEVLITGVREGDSLVIFDGKGGQVSYNIAKLFMPGYKEMNADSLVKVDKLKELSIMKEEQLKYGLERIENYIRANNPKAVKSNNVYVEILNKGIAPFADSGRTAAIKFTSRNLHTGKVITSNADTSFHLPPVYEYVVSTKQMYEPVDKIIRQLGKGGKARVYIPAIIALGDRANNPKTDLTEDVMFDVDVVSVR